MNEEANFNFHHEISLDDVDGISSIKINPHNSNILAISTWNGFVDIYDIRSSNRKDRTNLNCPQLALQWISDSNIASAGADGIIYVNGVQIGFHDAPISSLCLSETNHILASGSYDGVVKFWDSRTYQFITDFSMKDKIFCMASASPNKIVCGCLENRIVSLDCKTFEHSFLKTIHGYNMRQIAALNSIVATSVVQGRVAITNLQDPTNKYAFKAHIGDQRNDSQIQNIDNPTKTVYPINALCFQPNTEFLATGGTDGIINIWNIKKKRRLATLLDSNGRPFDTSISSLSFSNDGSILAASVSYCFELGPVEHPPDRLIIYTVQ